MDVLQCSEFWETELLLCGWLDYDILHIHVCDGRIINPPHEVFYQINRCQMCSLKSEQRDLNSQKWFNTLEIFEKHFTFFLLFSRFILKDQPQCTYSWAHLRKEAGSWARKKNLNFYPIHHSSRERRVLRSSTTSSQRWESIRSLSLHQVVQPVFSTAAWSTRRQIRFRIKYDHFVPQILETDPPHTLDAFTHGASTRCFLSRLKASQAHERLAMLARKRWAHHSSKSMGTKSAQRHKQQGRGSENWSLIRVLWFIHFVQ